MRIAFVYPGQGSLTPEAVPAWEGQPEAAVIDAVGHGAGIDLWRTAATPDAGASTAIAQPAIHACSLAAHDALVTAGVTPDVVAGHSLGELTAAVAAGALSRGGGAALVAERGRAMAAACRANPGAMAAIIRMDADAVQELVVRVPDAQIANDNAPGQIVVSGPPEAIESLAAAAREAGGRVIPLDVEGPFHSAAMAPALVRVDAMIRRLALRDPDVALVTGTDGSVLRTATDVHRTLVDGILAPVRWVAVQRRLAALGVDVIIECGPGSALKGMAKRTIPDVPVLSVAGPDDVDAVVTRVAALRDQQPADTTHLDLPTPITTGADR